VVMILPKRIKRGVVHTEYMVPKKESQRCLSHTRKVSGYLYDFRTCGICDGIFAVMVGSKLW
jgi:hypothetical protein